MVQKWGWPPFTGTWSPPAQPCLTMSGKPLPYPSLHPCSSNLSVHMLSLHRHPTSGFKHQRRLPGIVEFKGEPEAPQVEVLLLSTCSPVSRLSSRSACLSVNPILQYWKGTLNRHAFSSTVPTTHLVTWKNEILYVVGAWRDSVGPTPTKRSAMPRDWPAATGKFETSQITDIWGEHWGNKKGSILSLALKCHCSSLNWVSNKFKPLLQNSVFIWVETEENSRISLLSKCGLRGISEKNEVFPQAEYAPDPRPKTIPLGGTGNGGGFWVVKTSERCHEMGVAVQWFVLQEAVLKTHNFSIQNVKKTPCWEIL